MQMVESFPPPPTGLTPLCIGQCWVTTGVTEMYVILFLAVDTS